MLRAISSPGGRDKEGGGIGKEGAGKAVRGMLSDDNGAGASRGEEKGAPEGEWIVIPMGGSFGARGLLGGEKRRLGGLAASA